MQEHIVLAAKEIELIDLCLYSVACVESVPEEVREDVRALRRKIKRITMQHDKLRRLEGHVYGDLDILPLAPVDFDLITDCLVLILQKGTDWSDQELDEVKTLAIKIRGFNLNTYLNASLN